jgi:hypothetical protein
MRIIPPSVFHSGSRFAAASMPSYDVFSGKFGNGCQQRPSVPPRPSVDYEALLDDYDAWELDNLYPYAARLSESGMERIMDTYRGHRSRAVQISSFHKPEAQFLTREAIPAIVSHKLEQAAALGSNIIVISAKIFGIGQAPVEFSHLTTWFLHELSKRDIDGLSILIHGTAFDIDMGIANSSFRSNGEKLREFLWENPLAEQVRVTYDAYYGDLTDRELCLPAMLAYGEPDITLWRRTWIIDQLDDPAVHVKFMLDGLRQNISRPGGILIWETFHEQGGLYQQELVL